MRLLETALPRARWDRPPRRRTCLFQMARGGGERAACERCIERLETVVDQETAALKGRAATDLREFNNRKSQGLLELSRSLRYFQGATPSNTVLARLTDLRAKLDTNR